VRDILFSLCDNLLAVRDVLFTLWNSLCEWQLYSELANEED
jgi:hypothetical protein